MTCFNTDVRLRNGIYAKVVEGEIFVSLSDFDFEISILSLSTLIGIPLDIISKCKNILSKPNDTKVSSDNWRGTIHKCAYDKLDFCKMNLSHQFNDLFGEPLH